MLALPDMHMHIAQSLAAKAARERPFAAMYARLCLVVGQQHRAFKCV
jgi:hypothetical protein